MRICEIVEVPDEPVWVECEDGCAVIPGFPQSKVNARLEKTIVPDCNSVKAVPKSGILDGAGGGGIIRVSE